MVTIGSRLVVSVSAAVAGRGPNCPARLAAVGLTVLWRLGEGANGHVCRSRAARYDPRQAELTPATSLRDLWRTEPQLPGLAATGAPNERRGRPPAPGSSRCRTRRPTPRERPPP